MEINGKRLEFRRKVRWGKDLPVDITNFVQAGLNEAKVVRLSNLSDLSTYFAIIEVFECRNESAIKAEMGLLDEQQSRAEIVRRLSSNGDVDLMSVPIRSLLACAFPCLFGSSTCLLEEKLASIWNALTSIITCRADLGKHRAFRQRRIRTNVHTVEDVQGPRIW